MLPNDSQISSRSGSNVERFWSAIASRSKPEKERGIQVLEQSAMKHLVLNLRVGDWVEVRSREEILATLDEKGCLDNLPFMPEMFAFCGKRFQVYKRAHKTCDTVFPVRERRLIAAVHLET